MARNPVYIYEAIARFCKLNGVRIIGIYTVPSKDWNDPYFNELKVTDRWFVEEYPEDTWKLRDFQEYDSNYDESPFDEAEDY